MIFAMQLLVACQDSVSQPSREPPQGRAEVVGTIGDVDVSASGNVLIKSFSSPSDECAGSSGFDLRIPTDDGAADHARLLIPWDGGLPADVDLDAPIIELYGAVAMWTDGSGTLGAGLGDAAIALDDVGRTATLDWLGMRICELPSMAAGSGYLTAESCSAGGEAHLSVAWDAEEVYRVEYTEGVEEHSNGWCWD